MEPQRDGLFEISIKDPISSFSKHLNDESNKRILFSSPFGSGKTYFLTNFFDTSKDYVSFHLFPVNYSVSTNQDIFELIKYDLLFRILAMNVEFDHIKFGGWFAFESYIHFKPVDFFKSIFGMADKLGQTVSVEVGNKLIKAFEEINNNFSSFVTEREIDDKGKAIAYLRAQSNKEGSIHEYDHISILIADLINQLKIGDKEVVLIVDDLDRIDPEHIFRLLNIFAAHFDIKREENKFGFDKVIFVCDENNIRNIFNSKYGTDVDYTGYIDKFFSKKVYSFDNTEAINKYLYSLLKTIELNGEDNNELVEYLYSFKKDNLFNGSARYILRQMIAAKVFTIRSLERLYNLNYYFDRFSRSYAFIPNDIYDSNYDFIILKQFLTYVFGNTEKLTKELKKASCLSSNIRTGKLSGTSNESILIRQIIGNVVAIIDIESHNFENINSGSANGKSLEYIDTELGIRFEYVLENNRYNSSLPNSPAGYNAYIKKAFKSDTGIEISSLDFFRLLEKGILKLETYKL